MVAPSTFAALMKWQWQMVAPSTSTAAAFLVVAAANGGAFYFRGVNEVAAANGGAFYFDGSGVLGDGSSKWWRLLL
jgi:hypothetical protein